MIKDRIPDENECYELMARYGMFPNIVEHSRQVMKVALAITDNLKEGVYIDRGLTLASALLHDITKTHSINTGEKRHDLSGGKLLRELGLERIAEIVEEHVVFSNFDFNGRLEEREIVFYADKRVMHDKIVSLDTRIDDLLHRYGKTDEIKIRIVENLKVVTDIELKISRNMNIGIDAAILNYG